MLTLCLLRHAKSSWEDPSVQDFDRPLASRGEQAAPRMGAYMAEHGIAPTLILCSTAVRARQTLALVLPKLPEEPTVEFEDGLYLASPSTLLARLRKVRAPAASVMLVGHDPGMHALAVELCGRGEAAHLHRLASKFPTAALAIISFKASQWSQIKPKAGCLEEFMTPRLLQ
jgi:phosphohistidine phosphatase